MRFSRVMVGTAILGMAATASVFIGRTTVFAAPGVLKPVGSQAAQDPPKPSAQALPAPSNLRVLPRNLSGEQVMEIMEQWEGELGTNCKTCHVIDNKRRGPDGKPWANFADDSKDEKQTARKMFKMTEEINAGYISKIDSSGAPVTCGTCHRGHLGPEPYVVPEGHHHSDDEY